MLSDAPVPRKHLKSPEISSYSISGSARPILLIFELKLAFVREMISRGRCVHLGIIPLAFLHTKRVKKNVQNWVYCTESFFADLAYNEQPQKVYSRDLNSNQLTTTTMFVLRADLNINN